MQFSFSNFVLLRVASHALANTRFPIPAPLTIPGRGVVSTFSKTKNPAFAGSLSGRGGGIRTPGTRKGSPVFKTGAINRSTTPLFTFLEVFKTGAPDSYRENRSTAKGIPLGHSSVYFLEVFKTGTPDSYR